MIENVLTALGDGLMRFSTGLISNIPAPKYGPPIVKYGSPAPPPDQFTSALHHPEGILALLLVLGSLALYAGTIISWVFLGGILYLKSREKKK